MPFAHSMPVRTRSKPSEAAPSISQPRMQPDTILPLVTVGLVHAKREAHSTTCLALCPKSEREKWFRVSSITLFGSYKYAKPKPEAANYPSGNRCACYLTGFVEQALKNTVLRITRASGLMAPRKGKKVRKGDDDSDGDEGRESRPSEQTDGTARPTAAPKKEKKKKVSKKKARAGDWSSEEDAAEQPSAAVDEEDAEEEEAAHRSGRSNSKAVFALLQAEQEEEEDSGGAALEAAGSLTGEAAAFMSVLCVYCL